MSGHVMETFHLTIEGRVITLDAKTGKVIWDQQHADPKQNETFVAAPIAWDGKVFIGIGISDVGIRGRLVALDAKTGKELWRFYTVFRNRARGNREAVGSGQLFPSIRRWRKYLAGRQPCTRL